MILITIRCDMRLIGFIPLTLAFAADYVSPKCGDSMQKICLGMALLVGLCLWGATAFGSDEAVVFDGRVHQTQDFARILQLAQRGDIHSQFQAGLAYETGIGVAQDSRQAVRWYQKAADAGNQAAQNNLGGMYMRGLGVDQSDSTAFKWYLRAASEGYLPAQNNVGFMYAAGQGVAKNDEAAVAWYRKAADKNYAPAEANLVFMYSEGRGVPGVDGAEAVKWYLRAAKARYAPAEFQLGVLYCRGGAVPKDTSKGMKWLRQAAEHGSAPAENQIGYAYQTGDGVPQDYSRRRNGIAPPPTTDLPKPAITWRAWPPLCTEIPERSALPGNLPVIPLQIRFAGLHAE